MDSNSLPATPKRWERTMKSNGIPVLTLSICRPAFPDSGKLARIERYFSQLENQWKDYWESQLYPKAYHALESAVETCTSFTPWQAKLEYTVTLWHSPLLSLYLDASEGDFSGKPLRVRMGETWDCNTGYPRTLRSFFPPSQHTWRKQILEQIKAQAKQQRACGESLLDPNCETVMDRAFNSDHFYLTEEGVEIFYPLYALGPYGEGIPTFPIKLS